MRQQLISILAALIPAAPTIAAEQIVVRFSPIEQDIAVKELRAFVDRQIQSPTIAAIIEKANLNPAQIQTALTLEFDLKQFGLTVPLVDRLLSSYAAEIALRELGQGIRPRAGEATVPALRGAILTSLSDDGKISAIEFLEKYPTDLLIDGNVMQTMVSRVLKDIQTLGAPILQILNSQRLK
ncbi:MAG: alpha/beta hydrolase [Pseudanabaenaceae cyanobacterium bins.68]|nr:alpha/beta hydrolase [Pseudanabaenaceae cyanobacterium bins.68]